MNEIKLQNVKNVIKYCMQNDKNENMFNVAAQL